MLEKISRTVIYIACGALIIIPFIVTDNLFFPYVTGKNLLFRIAVEVMLVCWIVLVIHDSKFIPRKSLLFTSFSLFVMWMLVATLLGDNVTRSFWSNFERMEGWVTLAHLLALFVVLIGFFQTKVQWRRLWYATTAAATVMSVWAIIERFSYSIAELDRISISFGNPTYLAGYILLHLGIVVWLWWSHRADSSSRFFSDWKSWVYMGISVLYLLTIWFAGSRGTVLGVMGGVGIFALLSALWSRERPQLRKSSIVILLVIALCVGGFFALKDTSVVQDNVMLSRFAEISLSEGTSGTRFTIWKMALDAGSDHIVTGWGQGNFINVFAEYFEPSLYGQEPWFDRTHNVFLDWFIAGGLLGFLGYLSLFVTSLILIWKSEMDFVEKALFTALLGAYAIHNSFVFDNITSYIPFILLLGFFHRRGVTYEQQESSTSSTQSSFISSAVLVVGVILIILFNRPIYVQAHSLLDGLRYVNAGEYEQAYAHFDAALTMHPTGRQEVREQLAQVMATLYRNGVDKEIFTEYVNRAQAELELEIADNPNNLRPYTYYVNTLQFKGENERALEVIDVMLEKSPQRQLTYFQKANIYEIQGEVDKALEVYGDAYHVDTSVGSVLVIYASSLIDNGRVAEAQELLREHFGTTVVVSQDLIKAYDDAGLYKETIPILEEQVRRDSHRLDVHIYLIAGLYKAGEYDRAIEVARSLERFSEVRDQIPAIIADIQSRELRVE